MMAETPSEQSCWAKFKKEELQKSSVTFSQSNTDDLSKFLWVTDDDSQKARIWILLILRTLNALFSLGNLIASIIFQASDHIYLVYLTNWTFIILTIYLMSASIVSWARYWPVICCGQNKVNGSKSDPPAIDMEKQQEQSVSSDTSLRSKKVPVSLQAFWWLHSVAPWAAIFVTLLYFIFLYRASAGNSIAYLDLAVHGLNSVSVLLDFCVSAIPIKLLHFIWIVLYAWAYVLFSSFYQLADPVGNVLYANLLDWTNPTMTSIMIVVLSFVGIPILQLVFYGTYKLKMKIFSSCM